MPQRRAALLPRRWPRATASTTSRFRAACRSSTACSARRASAHCAGGAGPQPQGLFDALVNWVENGVRAGARSCAEQQRTAWSRARGRCARIRRPRSTTAAAAPTTRPTSLAAATSRRATTVCDSVLVKYKHEDEGPPRLHRHRGQPSRCEHPRWHDDDDDAMMIITITGTAERNGGA